jgi:SAM-dependent methyltransferase
MAFYDNFYKNSSITLLGKKMVNYQNRFFINLINKYFNKKNKKISVLEIGPGKGFFAEKCVNEGFDYLAIEINKGMCEKLIKRNIKVINGSVPPINVAQKFDVIFMNQVFEHMNNRYEAIDLIESCKEHLLKGGLIIISVPEIIFWKEDFFASDYTHRYSLSIRSLKQIFFDLDFKIVYATHYTLFFRGYVWCYLISIITRVLYNIGLIKLIFWKKSYKIKASMLPSCMVVGRLE